MKYLIAFMSMLLLVACQQPAPSGKLVATKSVSHTDTDIEYKSPKLERQMEELADDMESNLRAECIGADTETSIDRCIREGVLTGFDETGQAGRTCATRTSLEEFVECVTTISLFSDFVQRIDAESVDSMDWEDPEKSAKRAATRFTIRALEGCIEAEDYSDECVLQDFSQKLGLSDEEVADCREVTDESEAAECVCLVYTVKKLSEAVARIRSEAV